MSVFLPVSDDVNKAFFLPAYAFLMADFTQGNLFLTGQQLAFVYVAVFGVFSEASNLMERSTRSVADEMVSNIKKNPFLGKIVLSSASVVVLMFLVSLALLLVNRGAIEVESTILYLLYNSLVFANIFFVVGLLMWPISVFRSDIDYEEVSQKGVTDYFGED